MIQRQKYEATYRKPRTEDDIVRYFSKTFSAETDIQAIKIASEKTKPDYYLYSLLAVSFRRVQI